MRRERERERVGGREGRELELIVDIHSHTRPRPAMTFFFVGGGGGYNIHLWLEAFQYHTDHPGGWVLSVRLPPLPPSSDGKAGIIITITIHHYYQHNSPRARPARIDFSFLGFLWDG